MIGISTLAAMAQAAYRLQGLTHVASAIDARMEEVYWGAMCVKKMAVGKSRKRSV